MPTTHIKHCKRPQFNKIYHFKIFTTALGEKIWFQGVKITILNPIFVKASSFKAICLPIIVVSHC